MLRRGKAPLFWDIELLCGRDRLWSSSDYGLEKSVLGLFTDGGYRAKWASDEKMTGTTSWTGARCPG